MRCCVERVRCGYIGNAREMDKKIALFSCHRDPNYGSMLQAYALAEAIRKLGRNAEYVDYYSSQKWHGVREVLNKTISLAKRVAKKILRPKSKRSEFYFFSEDWFRPTIEAYRRFHERYIPYSAKSYYFNTLKDIVNDNIYDDYMVGSDQMWSPFLYDIRRPYFLDFASLPRKNAYAPSVGTTQISEEYLQMLIEKLSSFEHLSCRELSNCKTLSEAIGREVVNVLDPTLLLNRDDWDKVASANYPQGEYILAYILGEKESIVSFAEQLGKEKGLPVYYIVTRPKYRFFKNALLSVGPDDFVACIKHASYVVTDSFHGSLFSINYRVNFYAFSKREGSVNSNDNVRILEFLSILNLQDRFQDECNAKLLVDSDFDAVHEKLNALRQLSLDYLRECI